MISADLAVPHRPGGQAEILEGDSRSAVRNLEPSSFDLMVTSPPYLNSFDYTDIYRPELFAGKFVRNMSELRQLRLRTLRSHLQVRWSDPEKLASPMLVPILTKLRGKRMWNRRLPEMIAAYFEDMELILRDLLSVMRPGAPAWIVVSTSVYAGVHVPVDLLLGDVAAQVGWHLDAIHVLRNMRTASQQWSHLRSKAPPLRESLVVLRRPQ